MLDSPVNNAPDLCPRAPRTACQYSVTIQRGMSRTKGILLNISASGGFLQTESLEDIGSNILLLMRFSVPGQGRIYVSITARICRKSNTSEGTGYGIQWLQATCDDKPEGLRHLVEKILVGTTGRIQVLRNRENTERIAYTFDFANLDAVTKHALDLFEKSPELFATTSQTPTQPITVSSHTETQEITTMAPSLTKISENTDESREESLVEEPDKNAVETNKIVTGNHEQQFATEDREEINTSSTNNIFAMGGSDIAEKPADMETTKEDPIQEMTATTSSVSTENVIILKSHDEENTVAKTTVAPVIARSKEVPQSQSVDPIHVKPAQAPLNSTSTKVQSVEAMTQDRRISKRHQQTHQLVTTMIIKGNETTVVIRNMSRGGALIQTRNQIPEMDSTLTLKIESPHIRRAVRINGSVIRKVDQGSRNSLFAVRFTKPMHRGHAIELKRFFESVLPDK